MAIGFAFLLGHSVPNERKLLAEILLIEFCINFIIFVSVVEGRAEYEEVVLLIRRPRQGSHAKPSLNTRASLQILSLKFAFNLHQCHPIKLSPSNENAFYVDH
jgi:hypothetical protein